MLPNATSAMYSATVPVNAIAAAGRLPTERITPLRRPLLVIMATPLLGHTFPADMLTIRRRLTH
ncbi:hypothetical protein GCM10009753_09470 [Streptantibioticus ferralitis]